MKNRFHLLAAGGLLIPGVMMAWSSYYTDALNSTTNWIVNGAGSVNNPGYRNTSSSPGSLISSLSIPVSDPDVDVSATIQLSSTDYGRYVLYMRASNDAVMGPSSSNGFFYALVAEANVSGGSCAGTLKLMKRVGGTLFGPIWQTPAVCFNNTFVIQMVVRGSQLSIFNYGRHAGIVTDTNLTYGKPGVGGWNMGSSSSISFVSMDSLEYVQPNPPASNSIAVSSTATRVDFQFPGCTDDTNGKGIAYYSLGRAPFGSSSYTDIGEVVLFFGQFSDNGVSPGTAYTYQLHCWDWHLNERILQFDVTTPPSGSLDIRRTGVGPNDPSFGSLGANVNLISGNVNYNLPLIQAKARGGWGVTFSLNHDTQTWKKEGSRVWRYGIDAGYGHGWRVLAGTVTRYFTNSQVSMVVFTDSTGTQYRLDRKVNSDGSTASTYTGYWAASSDKFYGIFEDDWLSYRLRFPDGSFWDFGSRAAGLEGDYGAAFPTLFQDSNGNQVKVSYKEGQGLGYSNSSGRIDKIEDARAPSNSHTYAFGYTGFQLSSIVNTISTNEAYTFYYNTHDLIEPFNNSLWSGAANQKFLISMNVTNLGGTYSYNFDYFASGSYRTGELSKVTLPQGGYVRWNMGTWNYAASRSQREITHWAHSASGTSEYAYQVNHETAGTTGNLHTYTQITEPSGTAHKRWDFNSSAQTTQYAGLTGVGVKKIQVDSSWTTDGYGKPYISATTTTYDPTQSYAKSKRTEQTLDNFGNMTQMKLFDWGLSSGTPRRLYINTYLGTSPYSSFTGGNVYIKNRLLTSTYSENGATPAITLVQNEYDNYSVGCPTGIGSCVITATTGARQKDAAYTTSFSLRGNLTSSSKYGDGSNPLSNSTWTWLWYDDTGNVVKSKTPGGVVGTSVPDSGKNYAVPSSITVAGITNTMSWSSALNLTGTSGPNSVSTSTSYGSADFRPASKTNATGTVTTFAYTNTTTTATTNGRWSKVTTDGFGRTIKEETGSSGGTHSVVDTQYEPCACTPIGKLKKVSRPYTGSPTAWTTYNYDELGRTTSVVAPDGSSTTSYVYEGETVKVTDAAGKWKKFTQDAVGNLTQVNEPNPAGGADYVTTYTYDNFDRLTGVNMPRPTGTQTRTFVHGGFGVTSNTEPETGTTTYGYRTDGQISWKQDAKGQKVEYKYEDELITPTPLTKRLKEVRKLISGTEDPCQRVEYYYDGESVPDGDSGISSYASGRVSGVRYKTRNYGGGCSQTFVEQYSYKNYGAMVTKRLKMVRGTASGVLQTTADYDSEGRPTNTTYPVSGRTVAYEYDANRGLPSKLKDVTAGTDLVNTVSYSAAGQLLGLNVVGSGSEGRAYNANGQMTAMTMPGRSITYNYPSAGSNNGQIVSMAESGETITYQYDSLKRLTSATSSASWAQTYSYDGFGNMYNKAGTGGAPSWSSGVSASTNRLTSVSYDSNGNQLAAAMTSGMPDAFNLSYDVMNRMMTAENGASTRKTEYEYDPGNKRIYEKRTISGSSTEWVHFFGITGQNLGRYQFTIASNVITFYQHEARVWFGGKFVQKIDNLGNVSAPGQDRLASVGKYLPYGEEKPGASNPDDDNIKFATYTRDKGTGIDYADQRWHTQGTGRFVTSDPYQHSAGPVAPTSWNRFSYVLNDPITLFDPSGLCGQDTNTSVNVCETVDGVDFWWTPIDGSPNLGRASGSGHGSSEGPGGGGGGGGDQSPFSIIVNVLEDMFDNKEECDELRKKIEESINATRPDATQDPKGLKQRYHQFRSKSYRNLGHAVQFLQKQRELGNMLTEWDNDKCGDHDNEWKQWRDMPLPEGVYRDHIKRLKEMGLLEKVLDMPTLRMPRGIRTPIVVPPPVLRLLPILVW